MKTILNLRTLKAVAIAASTEQTRYYLNGVFVQARADHAIYVATDGHRMLVCREELVLPADFDGKPLEGDWIIPTDICNAHKVSTRGGDDLYTLELLEGGKLSLLAAGRVFLPIAGTFPDWRRVLPSLSETGTAQFNLLLLASFAKAAAIGGWGVMPAITHAGAGNTALVRFSEDKAFGAIMPIRNPGHGDTLPAWVNAK